MKVLVFLCVIFFSFNAFAAGQIEPLLDLRIDQSSVTIRVASGGCTSKESFETRLLETYPMQVGFYRVEMDYCEAYLPNGVELTWSYAELGLRTGDNFTVLNPTENSNDNPVTPPTPQETLELLLAVRTGPNGITIRVASGGCTSKESFRVKSLETYPVQIGFYRVRMDFCEAYLPNGVELTWSYEELGLRAGDTAVLLNSIQE